MKRVPSYLKGEWQTAAGEGQPVFDPVSEEVIAETTTAGLDLAGAVSWGRDVGGSALRAMSFGERAALLGAVKAALKDAREELLDLSRVDVGTPRGDAKFDVDGAIGTLSYYAHLGKKLAEEMGERRLQVEGEGEDLTRSKRYWGHHVRTPKPGIAVHLNAFNFPAWGLCEKLAVAWLAGVPVLTKPSPITVVLAHRVAEIIAGIEGVPAGAFQFLAGDPHDLLDHLGPHDVVAFTGGSETAAKIRSHANLVARGVKVNVEADSVNAAVLMPDVEPGSETWHRLTRDLQTEITQKSGQKCTATRRVFVPREKLGALTEALIEKLSRVKMGDPRDEEVRMGPLVSAAQVTRFQEGLARLKESGATVAWEAARHEGKGYFVPTTLLHFDPKQNEGSAVHELEVFGPVATLIAYDALEDVAAMVARGEGGLVNSLYGDDRGTLAPLAEALLPWSGRLFIASEKVAGSATTPGTVLPSCVHGGPGRAGGGEELGGLRGLDLYLQRTSVQGDRALIERFLGLR